MRIINFNSEWQYKIYKFCEFLIKTLQPKLLIPTVFILLISIIFNFTFHWGYLLITFLPTIIVILISFLIGLSWLFISFFNSQK